MWHKNLFSSKEQFTFTSNQNLWSSRVTSACVWWLNIFGIYVELYPVFSHIEILIFSHFLQLEILPVSDTAKVVDNVVDTWVFSVTLKSKQVFFRPSLGNCLHLNRLGQWKPYWRIKGAQPFLALSQSDRQGGNSFSLACSSHFGANIEHKKIFKSGEHLISTRGQNWWTSSAASSCVSWLNMFGMEVKL